MGGLLRGTFTPPIVSHFSTYGGCVDTDDIGNLHVMMSNFLTKSCSVIALLRDAENRSLDARTPNPFNGTVELHVHTKFTIHF